jgi:hypothetical protein
LWAEGIQHTAYAEPSSGSSTWAKQFIGFVLKLLNRDLATGVGLQMGVELIVFFHAGFASRGRHDAGTELLKVHAYPVEGEAASAIGTFNSRQCTAPCARHSESKSFKSGLIIDAR